MNLGITKVVMNLEHTILNLSYESHLDKNLRRVNQKEGDESRNIQL